jgi:predicted dehydrogenase
MKFDEKLMGKVLVSTGCKRNYTMRTVIYGTKGTIIVDNTSPTMSLFLEEIAGEKKMYGTKCINIEQKIPVKIANHNVAAEIDEFVECILTNTQPRISAEEGARAVAGCEAIIKSSATGKPEPIVY